MIRLRAGVLSPVMHSRHDYVLEKLSASNRNRPRPRFWPPPFRTMQAYHELCIYPGLEPGLSLFTKEGAVVGGARRGHQKRVMACGHRGQVGHDGHSDPDVGQ